MASPTSAATPSRWTAIPAWPWEAIPFATLLASMTGGDWGSDQTTETESAEVTIVRGTDFDEVAYGGQLRAPVRSIKPSSLKSRGLRPGDVIVGNSINAKSRCIGTALLVDSRVLARLGRDAVAASFCKVFRLHDPRLAPLVHLHFRRLREDARMEYYQNVAANGLGNFQAQKFAQEEHLILPKDEALRSKLIGGIAAMFESISVLSSRLSNLRRTRDLLLPRLLSAQAALPHPASPSGRGVELRACCVHWKRYVHRTVNAPHSMNEGEFEKQGLQRLEAVLREVPFVKAVKVEGQPPQAGWDAELVVRTRSRSLRLLVECKRRSEPRFLREASARFELARIKRPEVYPVVVASYVSPDSAAICREHGVGYLDLAGNCLLSVGEIHIHREGLANPFQEKRPLVALFSPKAERVLRALLERENWGRHWTFRDLADHVRPGVSLGYVHKVIQALRDEEYVQQSRAGIRLQKPEPLLREWAANYRFERNRAGRFFSLLRASPLEAKLAAVLNELDREAPGAAAFASFTAAGRIAPYVRQNRVWLYRQGDFSPVIQRLELKEVPSGENVVILEPYDEGVFYQCERQADGGLATGAVQTYLDVNASGGQGSEAAEKILERVLRPKWGGA